MARENRTGGFCASSSDRPLPDIQRKTIRRNRRRQRRAIPAAAFVGLEILESRLLLTVSPSLADGILTCTGTAGQVNTIDVALTDNGASIVATVDGVDMTCSTSSVQSLVINAGTRSDIINVDPGIRVDETLAEGNGAPPSPTGNTESSSVSSSGTSGSSSSAGSASSDLSSSIDLSSISGSSSSGTGSSISGSGSSNSASGSSSTGIGSSSTGTGSSGIGTGSSVIGSGSSSTGSGSSSTGTSSSGTGSGSSSSGSGSSSDPTPTPSNPNDPATPNAVITLTSPATVYPLESVNVQAVNSNFGSGTVLNSTITWDFGDPGSEYNTLVGYNAAHAYANPGTYTITLSIATPDGHVGVATQTVTIAPDNRPTIYVAADGNDANDGSSPNDPIQSLTRLSQLLSSNMRVLLRDGDTFTFDSTSINLGGLQHVYVGSYGSGAQPVLYYNGPAQTGSFIGTSNSTSGIVVQGLTFDSIYKNEDNKEAIPSAFFPTGNDLTIIDNTFLNLGNDMNLEFAPTNVLVQDNTSPDPTALGGYFAWTAGSEIAMLGNSVASSTGEAIVRIAGATDLELAYNNFTNNPMIAGTGPKNTLSTQVGQYIYVFHNTFSTGPVNAGPLGTVVNDPTIHISDVVFDSNTINNTTILLTPGVTQVMVENNVINATGDAGITIDAQQFGGSYTWTVNNIWIEHNTVIESGTGGGLLCINDGQAQDILMDYNLFVDPNYQINSGTALVSIDEDNMNSFSQILDNVWAQPTSINSWMNGGIFFVGSNQSSQTAWLTPAEWEASGIASGDVYENVTLGGTYSVNADGFTAGSPLPTS